MTDEERQKFCAELSLAASRTDKHGYYGPLCGRAADEIVRLAKELRISNKALSMCSDECNRSYELADRSDARHEEKIERLEAELEKMRKEYGHD